MSPKLLPAASVYASASEYDWCSLLLDHLMKSLSNFAKRFYCEGFAHSCGGCTMFLAVMYLDGLNRDLVEWDFYPRMQVWSGENMRLAQFEDVTGTGDFGALGCLDLSYGEKYPLVMRDAEPPANMSSVAESSKEFSYYCKGVTRKRVRSKRTSVGNPYLSKKAKNKRARQDLDGKFCDISGSDPATNEVAGITRNVNGEVNGVDGEVNVFIVDNNEEDAAELHNNEDAVELHNKEDAAELHNKEDAAELHNKEDDQPELNVNNTPSADVSGSHSKTPGNETGGADVEATIQNACAYAMDNTSPPMMESKYSGHLHVEDQLNHSKDACANSSSGSIELPPGFLKGTPKSPETPNHDTTQEFSSMKEDDGGKLVPIVERSRLQREIKSPTD